MPQAGERSPQPLADQLTLFQLVGHIMPTTLLYFLTDFQTFRHGNKLQAYLKYHRLNIFHFISFP